ncbi:hypothetical protein [Jannaschia seohaensis]|uniref:Uncharacterized protein n=1 Tax=Jannaschia seohaensis TaxID=475081 RepID=A0A2Y9B0Y0_9RHOB|nr:hypothetical protein [Jannaschia seohaensis]PWJ14423.1 hypothetical protein BCF38_11246 [Jannaschia seohaensis]SSA50150.1 hypothetical protein SAMN05421539_11246 [Jannaschia seohaensis]
MSRKIWLDRTIEAARTESTPMPWSRSTKGRPVQVKASGKG